MQKTSAFLIGLVTVFYFAWASASEDSSALFEFVIFNHDFFEKHLINPQPTALQSRNHYNDFSAQLDLALAQFSEKQPSLDCQKLPARIQNLRQYLQLAFYERQIFKKDFPQIGIFNTLKIYILAHYFRSLSLFIDLQAEGGLSVMTRTPLACQFSDRPQFRSKFQLALEHLDNYIAREMGLLTLEKNTRINEVILPYLKSGLDSFRSQDRQREFIGNLSFFAIPGMSVTALPRVLAWGMAAGFGAVTGYQWTRPYEKEQGASQIPLFYDELMQSMDFISRRHHPYEFYIQYFRMTLGLQKNMRELLNQVRFRFNDNFEKALKILKQKQGESHD